MSFKPISAVVVSLNIQGETVSKTIKEWGETE